MGSPHTLFKKTQVTPQVPKPPVTASEPKNPSVAKYGFDLSAFETSSSTPSPFGDSSATMKDELSSLFGSPSVSTSQLPQQSATSSGFDDIFGNSSSTAPQQTTTTNNNTNKPDNSFESIFFNK
jgi:hypothetical protein